MSKKTIIYSNPRSNVRPAPAILTPTIVGALLNAFPARANDHAGGGGSGARSACATSRRSSCVKSSRAGRPPMVSAPQPSHPVVDNKLNGGPPRLKGHHTPLSKPSARDWYIRRHEVFAAAERFLKARCILVDVVDRDAPIRRYLVSGKRNPMFLEDVVELAECLGFEGIG